MKRKSLALFLLLMPLGLGAADVQWLLQQSTLTYHVSHPLHQFDGVSHAARGKGVCHAGQCDFLVAVPVKSFDSGDSNRDLHMIQVARGAQFPMVTVRFRLPEDAASQSTIHVDLDIEFDFMDVSSYEGTESIGDVRIIKDLDRSIKNDKILLVEDIVDTGRTIKVVKKMLENKGAVDVKIVSLLDKPSRRVIEVVADYVGFTIPNEFVVGFGLDFNEKYRNLPYVGILKDECYK